MIFRYSKALQRTKPNISACQYGFKGVIQKKDQSYVLYMTDQNQLEDTLMALGILTKEKVRKLARQWKLGMADKSEEQEICFIPNNDYREYLQKHLLQVTKPRPTLNQEGKVLGEHKGILHYAIGQRKGIGMAWGRASYVVGISGEKNDTIVGEEEDLYADKLIAGEVNYIDRERLDEPIEVRVKIRYEAKEPEATLIPEEEDRVQVKFGRPRRAIVPGQAAVLYRKDSVVGGRNALQCHKSLN